MKTYYLTFSPKYRTVAHPILSEIDPQGWATLQADTYQEALKKANQAIGPYYDNIVSESYFDPTNYPLGELYAL